MNKLFGLLLKIFVQYAGLKNLKYTIIKSCTKSTVISSENYALMLQRNYNAC